MPETKGFTRRELYFCAQDAMLVACITLPRQTMPPMPKSFAAQSANGRILLILIFVIFFAVILVAAFSYMSRGDMVRISAQRTLSILAGSEVALGRTTHDSIRKQITMRNIALVNPEGFRRVHLAAFDDARIRGRILDEDFLSLAGIEITGGTIYLEFADGDLNIMAFLRRFMENVRVYNLNPARSPGPRVVIDSLVLRDLTLVPPYALAGGHRKPVRLPDIELSGLGRPGQPLFAFEAADRAVRRLASAVLLTAAREGFLNGLPQSLKDELGTRLGAGESFFRMIGEPLPDEVPRLPGLYAE